MNSSEIISGLEFAYLDRSLIDQLRLNASDLAETFRRKDQEGIVKASERSVVRLFPAGDRHVYLKLYCPRGAARWIRRGWARRRVLSALRNARRLASLEIKTAPILAVVVRDLRGAGTDSGIFTLSLAPAKTITLFFLEYLSIPETQGERRAVIEKLAGFLRGLHERGVYPKDFKDTNLLIRRLGPRHEFYMVDCDSLLFLRSVSRRRRLKNLVQIGITLGEALSSAERLFFLRAYAQGFDTLKADLEEVERQMGDVIHRRRLKRQRLSAVYSKGL
jgi:hypothetical protein